LRNKRLILTAPAEAAVLNPISVRLVRAEEQGRWDQLVSEHHYLKDAHLVGERLCYVAEYQGRWLALLGWAAAAYHLRARDTWIGWNDNQRRGRLHLVANNARFCVLGAAGQYPNLASRALALNLARLSTDWQEADGHPIQQAVWAWQKARLAAHDGDGVVWDGKALRGSRGTQLVGAINAQSGRPLGVEAVARKSNEIPAGQTLLDRLQLEGPIALMAARHTQVQTARTIVQEGGANCVLFGQGNPSGLLDQAHHFLPEDSSPSASGSSAGPRPD
jgi:hypothetical protein